MPVSQRWNFPLVADSSITTPTRVGLAAKLTLSFPPPLPGHDPMISILSGNSGAKSIRRGIGSDTLNGELRCIERMKFSDINQLLDARAKMIERLASRGISPARVDVLAAISYEQYLASYREVDIILDTVPFPGGTTTCEALWMGVPTLTLAGRSMLARQGSSMMLAAGLPEWVTRSADEYVARAILLAASGEALARTRTQMREKISRSALFDGARFARHLEDALFGMWGHYRSGRSSTGPPA